MPNLFPIIETNRGGKFTYHGPGQKIVYFVINLNKREKEIKKFVRNVEKWIIAVLNDFNISSFADPKNIGIWIRNNNEENKIAAIGIKVKKWIAYHGFSLNINVNKSHYRGIVPCGIFNKGIINISDLCNVPNDEKINNSIKENFYKLFNS
jgi:lipoyl(octanoyl) transferase